MSLEHPEKQKLLAFIHGQLDLDGIQAIHAHLESCEVCCETLQDLGDDTFISRLKQISAAPEMPPAALQTAGDTFQVPVELLNHPRYRVIGVLGRGGMGTVYLAEHRLMNRQVALKVINREIVTNPQAVQRFHREVQAAAKLSHPNIVAAFDAEQSGELHFLVMEYVNGTDLASVVNASGPVPPDQAVQYVLEAATGLQHAHEKGMVHRDIKPHNLMLTPEGHIRILDFGLAGLIAGSDSQDGLTREIDSGQQTPLREHPLTTFGAVMGTPDYIAPEQAVDAHSADIRADIYSLGCTFYYLLTGNTPCQAKGLQEKLRSHAEARFAPVCEINTAVPKRLSDIVSKMMARDPAARFQTPDQIALALRDYRDARPSRSRLRSLLIAFSALFFFGIAFGIFYIQTDFGTIIIEADDESLQFAFKEGALVISDEATGRKYRLAPGQQKVGRGNYKIEVTELPDGLQFDTTEFSLKRGGVQRIRVWVQANNERPNPILIPEPDSAEAGLAESDLPADAFAAVAESKRFLGLIDANEPKLAFESMSSMARNGTNAEQFSLRSRANLKQYGALKHRVLRRAFAVLPVPGLPEGEYFTVQFQSDFEKQSGQWEIVMLDLDPNGNWKVNAHGISPQPPSLSPRVNSDD